MVYFLNFSCVIKNLKIIHFNLEINEKCKNVKLNTILGHLEDFLRDPETISENGIRDFWQLSIRDF